LQEEFDGTTWKRQDLPPSVGWRLPEGEVKWREETGQLRRERIGAGTPTLFTAVVLRFQRIRAPGACLLILNKTPFSVQEREAAMYFPGHATGCK